MSVDEGLPFGRLGDLVEQLVPIAADLVQAVREEGPDRVWGTLHRVPKDAPEAAHLPGGAMAVFAVVCAGMVDNESTMRGLLGWADALIDVAPADGRVTA